MSGGSMSERAVAALFASADKETQRQINHMIVEIVNQTLLAKTFEPEAQRKEAFQKRAQEAAIKALKDSSDLEKRFEKLEAQTKKRLHALEETFKRFEDALKKMAADQSHAMAALHTQLSKQQTVGESTATAQTAALSVLREELIQAVAKERTRRLKLFSRWNDKHGLDVEAINEKLEREMLLLSQRSNKEFTLQAETLATLKDKLDYALMKRYGFVPDTRGGVGRAEYELPEEGEPEDEDEEERGEEKGDRDEPQRSESRKSATRVSSSSSSSSFGSSRGQTAKSLKGSDHLLLQKPQLRGVFNLCADAAGVVSLLDGRIDSLKGKVASLAEHARLTAAAQSTVKLRRRHVRNDDSSQGSASSSNYSRDSDG